MRKVTRMKTLDEVIEYFNNQCQMRHVYLTEDSGARFAEALHYLKEYRKLDSLDAVAFSEDDNPPLTWDELKTMEGKPVWVEEKYRKGDLKSSGWWLIDYWNDDQICLRDQGGNPWFIYQAGMGWAWKAYRKERE